MQPRYPMLTHPHPISAHPALASGVAAVAILLGGCQTYERRPLDLPGHQAAFLARTPDAPEVRAFARTLEPSPQRSVFDPADGITCAEAEVVALVFNADLRLARFRAGVTRATAENAGLWEDPTIGVDLTRIIESTPNPWKVFATVGLTIPISGRLEIEKQRAGLEHAAELARLVEAEWQTRIAVRRAWTEWSALSAQLSARREFVGRVDQVLAVVDRMEQAGELTRIEARLFRIERATTLAEFPLIESQAQQAELRLRRLMGLSPDAPLTLVADGIGPAPRTSDAEAAPSINREELARRSPLLIIALAEYETAEKSLELEVRRQYPDLQIGPGYGREDGQDQVLFGFSLPLPILNGNRRGIAEALARRDLARASAEAKLEELFASARAVEVHARAAELRRRNLESDIVPLVDAQYADARHVAQLGEVNTLILLESLSRQHGAKVQLIEARRDEALAAIDLIELLGPEPPAAPANVPPLISPGQPAPPDAPHPNP